MPQITYVQRTGSVYLDGAKIGTAYSGFGDGLDNPALEAVADVGPIPAGLWQIVRWDAMHADKGPEVAVLVPVGHSAHGRTDFLCHGPHANDNHDSSHGCIVALRPLRDHMKASGATHITVVAEEADALPAVA